MADGLHATAPVGQPVKPPPTALETFWSEATANPFRRTIGYLALICAASVIAGIATKSQATGGDYFFVLLLGSAIGVADVLGRYQEAPLRTLGTWGAFARITANAAASAFALWLIKIQLLPGAASITSSAGQVFAAGFGALALLRISFKVRIAEQDISIGPATLIDTILAAADRDANRSSAVATVKDAFNVQRRISYADILTRLAPLCIEVPQTLSDAERQALYDQIKKIADRADGSDRGPLVLAVVARAVGWDVIEAVMEEVTRASDTSAAALAAEAIA